ncbi:MAG: peroxiredoxin-like protein [Candidatus Azotimanducaceae bacterium]|jgi:peroxiredoxin-like protein
MKPLPHQYTVDAHASDSVVSLSSAGVPTIETAAPIEFGGPGGYWSPETLLTAAVADCFILSFKAIARASKFSWEDISCTVVANLDRVDKVTRFTTLVITPKLVIAESESIEQANKLLAKAEANCLVSNSMQVEIELIPEVSFSSGQ